MKAKMEQEERVRCVFIGMPEVAWLRCGPAPETLLDSFNSLTRTTPPYAFKQFIMEKIDCCARLEACLYLFRLLAALWGSFSRESNIAPAHNKPQNLQLLETRLVVSEIFEI